MNASIQRINLDLLSQDSMEYVHVRQGDTAKAVSARITESGTPYELADDTAAVFAARMPDGTYTYAECEITDNRILVTLPAEITAAAGLITACLRITGAGEAALTTPPFSICVEAPAAPEEEGA